jgi:hypothetical protein
VKSQGKIIFAQDKTTFFVFDKKMIFLINFFCPKKVYVFNEVYFFYFFAVGDANEFDCFDCGTDQRQGGVRNEARQ